MQIRSKCFEQWNLGLRSFDSSLLFFIFFMNVVIVSLIWQFGPVHLVATIDNVIMLTDYIQTSQLHCTQWCC